MLKYARWRICGGPGTFRLLIFRLVHLIRWHLFLHFKFSVQTYPLVKTIVVARLCCQAVALEFQRIMVVDFKSSSFRKKSDE